jgi:hypothetical protein
LETQLNQLLPLWQPLQPRPERGFLEAPEAGETVVPLLYCLVSNKNTTKPRGIGSSFSYFPGVLPCALIINIKVFQRLSNKVLVFLILLLVSLLWEP